MSNIAVTEGAGKTVATETIGGVEYGLVKLVDATAGSTTRLGGDAGLFRVSALADNGSVSAKSGDANQVHVSCVQGDAGLMRVSSLATTVGAGLTLATAAFDIGTGSGVAVVAGTAAQKIYVYGIHLTFNASGATKWQSGSTDLQGLTRLSASGGYNIFVNPPFYVIATTSAGQDLNLNLSATSVSASGWVAYWKQ